LTGQSLKETLSALVEKKFSETNMLVWYDAGGTIEPIIHQIVPKDVDLIQYDGSYLQIRAKIDKEGDLQKKRLIYIPRKPIKPSWLRDYELFGERMETNLHKILHDSFGLKTNPELASALTSANCKRLANKWDEVLVQVEPPLSEEKLEEALIAAIIDQSSRFDIKKAVLEFLGHPEEIKTKLEKSGLRQIFLKLLHKNGLPHLNELEAKQAAATLLLTELIFKSKGINEKELEPVLVEEKLRRFWSEAVHEWATDSILIESFLLWSQKIESEYDIKERISGIREIEDAESFKAVDNVLLNEIKTRISTKGAKGILENAEFINKIAKVRENKIWAREGKIKEWNVLIKVVELLRGIENSLTKITDKDILFTESYSNHWWKLDQIYRELASLEKEVEDSIRSAFLKPVASKYQNWLEKTNKAFTKKVNSLQKWPLPNTLSQNSFWKKFVKPHNNKICIFFLDALRFELQKRLLEVLKQKGHKVKHTPMLCSLPSITEVCMPALLPHDEMRLESSEKDLTVKLDGQKIKTKADRLDLLKRLYGDKIAFLELDQLKEDLQTLQKLVKGARIVLVTDIEIDKAGTSISRDFLDYFDNFMDKVRIGVEKAALLGYQKITITTDHGFLITPDPNKVKTVESFPNKGLTIHRRYAIDHPPRVEACFTLPLQKAGYNSKGEMLFPFGISYLPRKGPKEMYIHGGLSLQECCIGVLEIEPQGLGKPVSVRIEVSEPITTQIFRIKIIPFSNHLVPIPRTVKVELWAKGELVGEQKPVELSQETKELKFHLRKIPEKVEIQVRDFDTKVLLDKKLVSVALEGYDELL